MATYVQHWRPGFDGLGPDDRAWWDGHRAANYRHARHFLRAARKWLVYLDGLVKGRAGQRKIKHALESALFCLTVAERARRDARWMLKSRNDRGLA